MSLSRVDQIITLLETLPDFENSYIINSRGSVIQKLKQFESYGIQDDHIIGAVERNTQDFVNSHATPTAKEMGSYLDLIYAGLSQALDRHYTRVINELKHCRDLLDRLTERLRAKVDTFSGCSELITFENELIRLEERINLFDRPGDHHLPLHIDNLNRLKHTAVVYLRVINKL